MSSETYHAICLIDIFYFSVLDMTHVNYSSLKWRRTSRNTDIAILHDNHYGNLLFKRSGLINETSIGKQICAYQRLRTITSQMQGVTSPFVLPKLSKDNIIALEYIAGPSFHELWRDRLYGNSVINSDIETDVFDIGFISYKLREQRRRRPTSILILVPKIFSG